MVLLNGTWWTIQLWTWKSWSICSKFDRRIQLYLQLFKRQIHRFWMGRLRLWDLWPDCRTRSHYVRVCYRKSFITPISRTYDFQCVVPWSDHWIQRSAMWLHHLSALRYESGGGSMQTSVIWVQNLNDSGRKYTTIHRRNLSNDPF